MKFIKFILFLFIIFNYSIVNANEKIVYCDIDYIINNSIAGKDVNKNLEKIKESNLAIFKKNENNLKDKELKIIKQKNALSKEQYEKNVLVLREEILKYKKSKKLKINQVNKMRIDAQVLLLKKLNTILSNYSKNNSISIVLPKNNIIIGKSELDITAKIIKIVDNEVKKIKLK